MWGRETAGARHGDTSEKVAGVRVAEFSAVEAHVGTGGSDRLLEWSVRKLADHGMHLLPRASGWHSRYNCWPPLSYHHFHFSGPPSSLALSHPSITPEAGPYYINSVASVMSVDRPTSQVTAGRCSAPRTRGVGGTGVILKIVGIYLNGVAGGSARPFGTGSILFLEAGTTSLATCSSGPAITSGIKNVF